MQVRVLLLMLLVTTTVYAQDRDDRRNPRNRHRASLAIGAQAVQPIGDFATQYKGTPLGLSANIGIPIHRLGLEVVPQFSWNSMGTFNKDITVNSGVNAQGDTLYNPGTYRLRNNDYRYEAGLRFKPFDGAIQPYAEGILGFETFKTQTDISVTNQGGFSTVQDAQVQNKSTTLLAGYGLGLRFRLNRGRNMFFDIRYQRIAGAKAKYILPESVYVDSKNELQYSTANTYTNRELLQIGISFRF
jgi:Outer membrane protein beta-barrel domain